jgi:hypothetical protein
LAAMCMFYFEDQCHGLWLIKTCKTCGRPWSRKLFPGIKHAWSGPFLGTDQTKFIPDTK